MPSKSVFLSVFLSVFVQSQAPAAADVGYVPSAGARSLAGTVHGHAAVAFNPRVDPWEGGRFDRSRMAGRYGPWWEMGAPGLHTSAWAAILQAQCEARTASWITDQARYAALDCLPSEREVDDAYYTGGFGIKLGSTSTPQATGGGSTTTTTTPPTCPDAGAYTKDRLPADRTPVEFWDRLAKARHQGLRVAGTWVTPGGTFTDAQVYYWRPATAAPEVR